MAVNSSCMDLPYFVGSGQYVSMPQACVSCYNYSICQPSAKRDFSAYSNDSLKNPSYPAPFLIRT